MSDDSLIWEYYDQNADQMLILCFKENVIYYLHQNTNTWQICQPQLFPELYESIDEYVDCIQPDELLEFIEDTPSYYNTSRRHVSLGLGKIVSAALALVCICAAYFGYNYLKGMQIMSANQKMEVFYYNPLRGGTNCDGSCATLGNGDIIIENGNPVGPWWWNQSKNYGGAACPTKYRGKNIEIKVNNEIVTLTCVDSGGMIYEEGNVIRVDVLFEDGQRRADAPYNYPQTKTGQQLSGYKWDARVK